MSNATLRAQPMTNSRFQYKAELAQIMNVNVQIGSSYKLERMSKTYTYQNKEIKTKKGTIKISENHKDGEQLPTQFIAYLRVSSDKQDVKQQKNAIENMVRNTIKEIKDSGELIYLNPDCVTKGGDILYIHEKQGTSAWEKRGKSSLQFRPIGQFVHEMIREDLVERVFISELSRLYRNMAYCAMFREQLIYEWNSNADVIWPRNTYGLKDKQGAIAITIQMLQDEEESNVKSDRVSNATEVMRDEGLACTKYTWGWDRMSTGKQTKHKKDEYKVEPNWDEQSIRQWGIDKIENEGWSAAKVARKLDKLGIKGKAGGKFQSARVLGSFYEVKMNDVLHKHPIPSRMPTYPWTNYRKSQG